MPVKKITTIFIGTPDFGVPALCALIKDDIFDVVAVITQPDKKTGRKQVLTPPPIKLEAQKYKIPVYQPEKISRHPIANIDLIVVAAYAQILPESILSAPKYGCINIHGSLLPKYRGAACIQHAIMNGDKETGITIMKMDKGLDTGPILAQKSVPIEITDTAGTIFDKLSLLGAELLLPTIKNYIAGKIEPEPQDDSRASYARQLKKEDGRIDFKKSAEEIERFVRAMSPWPGAFLITNKTIKIIETERKTIKINKHKPGKFFVFENKLAVQCGTDALIINKIQPEGKKIMSGEEFINGYRDLLTK
ncbi:MAG: methionyl-tRNA formyltransferase [Candidatus Falkowbacteria bacterium]